jgi:hypothetical protein
MRKRDGRGTGERERERERACGERLLIGRPVRASARRGADRELIGLPVDIVHVDRGPPRRPIGPTLPEGGLRPRPRRARPRRNHRPIIPYEFFCRYFFFPFRFISMNFLVDFVASSLPYFQYLPFP